MIKSLLRLCSLIACGMIAAAVFMSSSRDAALLPATDFAARLPADSKSLVFGVLGGAVIAWIASVSWGEIPKRTSQWFCSNERNFSRMGLAAALLGVLLFY